MAKKKKAVEMSMEEMMDAGMVMGEELKLDLFQMGAQALTDEDQEIVHKAREGLWELLDIITASVPPEPSEEHLEYVHKMCKTGVYLRNVVRSTFLKARNIELPEEWERIGGSVH